MNILLLEDNLIRIEKFKKLFKNQKLFICINIEQAKDVCLHNEIDILQLDHDLDQRQWVESNEENTGYQFCKWLIKADNQKNALCYIHSMNFVGANNMMNLMIDNGRDVIWHPYHLLKI